MRKVGLPTEAEIARALIKWRNRREFNLSLRDAAKFFGVDKNVYYRAECGKALRTAHYRKIVDYLIKIDAFPFAIV